MKWEEVFTMMHRPGFHPMDPHVRNTKDGRTGIIERIESRKRITVRWFGGFGGENECAEYDLKEENTNLEAWPPRAKFRLRVLDDKTWISCLPLNPEASALIHNKQVALYPSHL